MGRNTPRNEYIEIAAPVIVNAGSQPMYNKAYMKGDLRIWISRELYQGSWLRWHMSISTATRYPVWDEIRDAWYSLAPPECKNVTMGMLLPPQGEYVNLHPNCFHLHEVEGE